MDQLLTHLVDLGSTGVIAVFIVWQLSSKVDRLIDEMHTMNTQLVELLAAVAGTRRPNA